VTSNRCGMVVTEELSMIRWFAPALTALSLAFSGPAIDSAAADALQVAAQVPGIAEATDVSSRRSHRRHRHYHGDRAHYRPRYYARPYEYRPYPYSTPAPFVFGLNFGP
jgi:hypothetical protein